MTNARLHCAILAAALLGACSRHPEWVEIGSISVFDPMTGTHVLRTLQNLGIKWRHGREMWRGYYVEVRDSDRDRATAALAEDQRVGNIDFLLGRRCLEPKQEVIRRPAAELLKTPRFAEGTTEGAVMRIPQIQEALKSFRHVDWVSFRHRTYLGEDDKLHDGLDGEIMLAGSLEEDIGSARFTVYVWKDGLAAAMRGGNCYWRGDEKTIKANKKKYDIPD